MMSHPLGLIWTAIDGVMRRAVQRGLARRSEQSFIRTGVDETSYKSYKKGHKYIPVVSDSTTGTVLYADEGRTKASLKHWHDQKSPEQLAKIENVSWVCGPRKSTQRRTVFPKWNRRLRLTDFMLGGKSQSAPGLPTTCDPGYLDWFICIPANSWRGCQKFPVEGSL